MAVHLFWPGCLSDFKHCFFMTYMIHDMVETSQWICPWRKRFVLLGNLWEWFMYIQNDWIYIVNILFSIVSVSYAFKFRSFAFIYIQTPDSLSQSHHPKLTSVLSVSGRLKLLSANLFGKHASPAGRRYHRRKLFASSNEELVEEWSGTSGRCSTFFERLRSLKKNRRAQIFFLVAVYIEINVLFFFGMCCWVRVSWLQFYAEEKHKGTHRVCLEL